MRQVAWAELLHARHRVSLRIDAELAARGLLQSDWYGVLLALSRSPCGRLRLSDLADRVLFSRSGLTRLVDRIEADGLICRQRCPEDRRGQYAALTDKGREAMRRTWAALEPLLAEHFGAHLTDAEAAAIHKGLARVIRAHGGADKVAPSEPVKLNVRPKG
ncbi:MAG TPA: MarR family transcriptional regulator [Humisphaera sp.]